MITINNNVVNGFVKFNIPSQFSAWIPAYASPACLSQAEQTPFTNRVPDHEPWPRVLMVNTADSNSQTDEYLRNTNFNPQFNDDGSTSGSQPIGRIEGDETIQRGPLWRR